MEDVAFRIKSIRVNNHMTQKEFAEKIMVSQSYLSRIERGAEIPNKKLIMLIALKFNVNTDWLLYGTSEPSLSKDNYDYYDRAYSSEITNGALETLAEFSEKVLELNDSVLSGNVTAILVELLHLLKSQNDESIRTIIIESIGSVALELCIELKDFSKDISIREFKNIKMNCIDTLYSQLDDLETLIINRD